jgi:hypothetical protein
VSKMQVQSNILLTPDEEKVICEFNELYNNWYNTTTENVIEGLNKHYFLLTFLENNPNLIKLMNTRNIRIQDIIGHNNTSEVLHITTMLEHILFDNIVLEHASGTVFTNDIYEYSRKVENKQQEMLSKQDVKNVLYSQYCVSME